MHVLACGHTLPAERSIAVVHFGKACALLSATALDAGGLCPKGSYCEEGSPRPVPCSNGTYTNYSGAAECDPCPAGYWCVLGGAAEPCPAGHYCPTGTGADILPCPIGTYANVTGLSREADCVPCPGE